MIKIRKLTVEYEPNTIIDELTCTFNNNEISCLCGPSGCGKSTLLNTIAGLLPYEGELDLPERVSYIFQEDRLLPWKTVYENIYFVLKDIETDFDKAKHVNDYIELVGLSDFRNSYPETLSGGMKRRVSIARAFAYPSDVLLMDEPFKGLDKALKQSIIDDFLTLWRRDKRTVILVTHDEEEAHLISDSVYYLKGLPLEILYVKSKD